ncbi:MAG: hypothetical protein JNG85_13005, partial [Spirochaetaceae bacterium]|nr:hypothetical protein [Spirochaetaceae bacterium]
IGNIAELCAIFLRDFEKHKNRAYVVTGRENLDFAHVAGRIRELTGGGISYEPISPVGYILHRLRRKSPLGMALVTCALHFLPRLQGEPGKTETYKDLTGKDPTTIDEFIKENREVFTKRA